MRERFDFSFSSLPIDNPIEYEVFLTLRTFQEEEEKSDRMYLLADKDCDAGKCEWWPLPPGRPRVCCVTDDSDASCFDTSWPFEVDDDADEGVNDDVKYCEAQSFCK